MSQRNPTQKPNELRVQNKVLPGWIFGEIWGPGSSTPPPQQKELVSPYFLCQANIDQLRLATFGFGPMILDPPWVQQLTSHSWD